MLHAEFLKGPHGQGGIVLANGDLLPGLRPVDAEHVTDPTWPAAHNRMAALSTNSSHRAADATHVGLLDEEQGADLSARAIDDVVQAARSGTSIPPD